MRKASSGFAALILISGALALRPVAATAESGVLTLTLEPAPYELVADGDMRSIEMEGFGRRPEPGKPLLPARTELYLLPPGAVAISLEIRTESFRPLAGRYSIRPAGTLRPLSATPAELDAIWQAWESTRRATYDSDAVFPGRAAEIVGAGSLREYSYVAVTYYPFGYHPRSGKLALRDRVEVAIHYEVPTPAATSSSPTRSATARAARLFANWDEARALYPPPADSGADREVRHDYLIVTTSSLRSAVTLSEFIDWKTALGFRPMVVTTSNLLIADQPGADLAEKIRNFLRGYYLTWGIEYVLLVGNGPELQMRSCYPSPSHHETSWATPTDHYFADLSLPDSGSWDLDGDGYRGEYGQDLPDFLAEVAVGRIPTDVPERVTYALDKIVRCERDTGAWKDNVLNGGPIIFHENQNGEDMPFREGALCMDLIETSCMAGMPVSHYSEHVGLVDSEYPWPSINEYAFTSDWRGGAYGIVNWVSHGNVDRAKRIVWLSDDGDGIFEQDGSDGWADPTFVGLDSDLDDDHPSIVNATACWIGKPDVSSLGTALLTDPGIGAAVGVFSWTHTAYVSHYWPDEPGGAEELGLEFNRFLLDGPAGPERLGDAIYDCQLYCHVNSGWNSYEEYDNLYGLNLYGDPSLERSGIAITAAPEGEASATVGSVVLRSHPNPCLGSTRISFVPRKPGRANVAIFDVAGRKVATLLDGKLDGARFELSWDGRDDRGDALPSGVYLCRLSGAAGAATRRIILLR